MTERKLVPAERIVPDPEGGWKASDLDPSELVDDAYIAADPDSSIVTGSGTDVED